MDEYRIKFAKVKIYSDGTRRCSLCNQRILPEQKECPMCHASFSDVEFMPSGEPSMKQEPYVSSRQTIRVEEGTRSAGRTIIVLAVLLVFVFSLAAKDGNIGGLSVLQNLGVQQKKHLESPSKGGVERPGFDYKITQLFITAENTAKCRLAIEEFLKDTEIEYENLYYTDTGYFTCDLLGYSETTKEKCEEQAKQISDALQKWCIKKHDTFGIKNVQVQMWYRSTQ